MPDPRLDRAAELQAEGWSRRRDATGWFDQLYAEAQGNRSQIPWADKGVNPLLAELGLEAQGETACVVGCGLGDDAEHLSSRGFAVTAFDISPTAVEWCQRQSGSRVRYAVADLFHAAGELGQFDFVLESHTLQALPRELRGAAVAAVAALVRRNLLVLCRGCDEPEPGEVIPWPLTRAELAGFEQAGLAVTRFEDFLDARDPPRRRFRVQYTRA